MTFQYFSSYKKAGSNHKGSHNPAQVAVGFFVGRNPDITKDWKYQIWKKISKKYDTK